KVDGKEYSFPIVTGTEGERGVDISNLRTQTGLITLDSGYTNTGSCESAITFIDGEAGRLVYRGIPIEEMAEHSSFLETAYLIINGHLPNQKELNTFCNQVARHSLLHEDMKHFYDGFPRDAHPMALLSSAVSTLAAFYQKSDNPLKNPIDFPETCLHLLGKLPTIAAYAYRKSLGEPFVYPDFSLSYCANFLHMMYASPAEPYVVPPEAERALNLLLLLHADHEQNCSTSAVRLVGSSRAGLYTSISAGISALWGPLHGGANQEALEMLEAIRVDGRGVKTFVDRVKNKEDGAKLYGFGHRVYKNFDPRATIIKKACDAVLDKLHVKDPLLEIAKELEETALKDDYFISRKLYPNVDFYSGIIYRAIGIPTKMFTVMFSLGRLPGWIAQWKEMWDSPQFKISRPRQIYTGLKNVKYVPIEKRS
ncbi:MAG: citrate synthase, partial [Pseudomonadota bacterium]